MPGVPAFILRRLYVKGSLHNRADGWGFTLKNTLGSGYGKELLPLWVDGDEIPKGSSFFQLNGREVAFAEVTEDNTFSLKMNTAIPIFVRGSQLEEGAHKVRMGFVVPGFGELSFDFTDEVLEGPPGG